MYGRIGLLLGLSVASSGVFAQGCVSGVAVLGTRHGDDSAIGEVVFVNTYPTIKACNESMGEASKTPLSHVRDITYFIA
jgi:hypothetical protein